MKKQQVVILVAAFVALVVIAAAVTLVLVVGGDDTVRPDPAPTHEQAPTGLEEFYDQELDWEDCEDDRCAWVEVPIDYADPAGETTQLRVVVVAADGDGGRSLFVNPGGPGGSAIDYARMFPSQLGDEARELYDIVGVDPRGVGECSTLECYSDEEFANYSASDPTPDDPAEEREFVELLTGMAQACEENSGSLVRHVSTVEAARDMDIVRALVGADELDWFGASYGTFLGATYASLFPDKVGRMVLDGAVDPSLGSFDSAMAQVTGFERAVQAFTAWCVGRDGCPLGTEASAGIDRLAGLLQQLDATPMPTAGERDLTEGLAFFGIALPLYNEGNWPVLWDALDSALNDNDGSELLYLSDLYFERDRRGNYESNIGQVITAVNCLDSLDRPTIDETKAHLGAFEAASKVFGTALGWGAAGCSAWPFEAEGDPVDIEAHGAPPILVLGTTRDPATPYESAVALADMLASGVLITRDGDGHTAYNAGNGCINDVVDGFLVDGIVPDHDPRC